MTKEVTFRNIIFCLLTLISVSITSQQDCNSAFRFTDTLGDFQVKNGFGKKLEISGNSIKNDKLFTKEHATAWVIIEFSKKGVFSFDLIPDVKTEDFDFIVFEYFGEGTCDSVFKNLKQPIRSNLSRRNEAEGSVTGLRSAANDLYTAAGIGSSFSKSISVEKGSRLLLVFDAPYGVRTEYSILNSSIFEDFDTDSLSDAKAEVVLPKTVTFHIFGDKNQIIPKPKAILRTLSKEHRTNLKYDSTGNIVTDKYRSYAKQRVLVTQPGFVQKEFEFKWTGRSDTIIEYHLTALQEVMKLQFENILFQTNSSNILKGSEEELENLSVFLLSNQNLIVEIGGHIYSGKRRNKRKFIKLSRKRAKVVYNYLIGRGVDKSNLRHKGYGNSKMVYRFPKSEKEYRANRRVELIILSIN